jgi:predicted translin family RNA/ssDNA-binding protein
MDDFTKLREEMEHYDAARERIIKRSRDINKESKQAIYALQRDAIEEAKNHIKAAETAIGELLPAITQDPTLRTGGFSAGVEEHVEARALLHFLEHGALLPRSHIPNTTPEEYLGGIADLTGELVRYAVVRATKGDRTIAQRARDVVDAINGALSQFDLRNGDLRRKYDSVKYALQKLEQVLYDLSLRPIQ